MRRFDATPRCLPYLLFIYGDADILTSPWRWRRAVAERVIYTDLYCMCARKRMLLQEWKVDVFILDS